MINNAELDYVRQMKQWSIDARKAVNAVADDKFMALIRKLRPAGATDLTLVYDHIDWMIALIEREAQTQRVRHLSSLGDKEAKR